MQKATIYFFHDNIVLSHGSILINKKIRTENKRLNFKPQIKNVF